MNKELIREKVMCQKCKGSRWKTLEKGKRVQCRLCGTEAAYIKVKPICDGVKPVETKPSEVKPAEVVEVVKVEATV